MLTASLCSHRGGLSRIDSCPVVGLSLAGILRDRARGCRPSAARRRFRERRLARDQSSLRPLVHPRETLLLPSWNERSVKLWKEYNERSGDEPVCKNAAAEDVNDLSPYALDAFTGDCWKDLCYNDDT